MIRAIVLAGICGLTACGTGGPADRALPPVTLLSPDSANHLNARFSPDGSRLFWWEPAGQANQLWTAAADLGNPTKAPVTSLANIPPVWSPDGSQMLVASSDSGLMEAALLSTTGGTTRQLTRTTGISQPMAWHRDGDRVAYISTSGGAGGGTFRSFMTSLSRGGAAPLLPNEKLPSLGSWSPLGTHIVYVAVDGSKSTLWVSDSVGANARPLTTDGFEVPGGVDVMWSPDGKEVLYESSRTGTKDLWVASIDGRAPRQLTSDIRNDWGGLWSPDGKWVAFMSDRGKQTDVWLVPAAGGPEVRVTDDAMIEELMQWRSNSTLAFLTGQSQSAIWSMSLAGGAEQRLTPDSLRTGRPKLSPDGTQIAFRVFHGGGVSDIALVPVAGGALRTLVQGGDNDEINWSPDGATILYSSDRSGTRDVWVVDVASGASRQLMNWPSLENNLSWSGDGSMIYFVSDREARLSDIWRIAPAGGEATRVTTAGAMNNLVITRGHPEVFASALGADGRFEVVRVNDDRRLTTLWRQTNSFPGELLPKGDSLLIVEGLQGGFAFRLISTTGKGDGTRVLNPGEGFSAATANWDHIVVQIQAGATKDLVLLNRKDGTTRRLTTTPADETSAEVTPDSKTLVFQRSRNIRRIATADLGDLFTGRPRD